MSPEIRGDPLQRASEWLREYNEERKLRPTDGKWSSALYWGCLLVVFVVLCWCCWLLLQGGGGASVLLDMERSQLPPNEMKYPPLSSVRRGEVGGYRGREYGGAT